MDYDFLLKETDGKDISLQNFKGKNVVLYFYPKDNTPGWTTEAVEFVELLKEFERLNTVIIGISRDSLKSHVKFRDKYNIPFLLLSDETEEVHNLFKVKKRSTFVFNKEGTLIKEFRDVKAKGHAKEVLDYINSLG